MIFQILKKSFQKIPQLYLYVIPLTLMKFVPYEFEGDMNNIRYLILVFLLVLGVFSGYYQNFLSIRSIKTKLDLKSIKKDFKLKFKRWILTSLLVLWKIIKWLIPVLISFAVAGELFNHDYHIITNLFGFGLLFLGTYLLYKLAIVIIEVSMAGLIAIEKKKPTKEILNQSKEITTNKKMFLVKIGLITTAITMLVSMLSFYLIFTSTLGIKEISEINSANFIAIIIYILIDNICTTLSVNVHGQAYKSIK